MLGTVEATLLVSLDNPEQQIELKSTDPAGLLSTVCKGGQAFVKKPFVTQSLAENARADQRAIGEFSSL